MTGGTSSQATDSGRVRRIGLNAQLLSLDPSYRSAGINRYIYNVLVNLPPSPDRYRFSTFLSDRRFPAAGHLNARWSRLPTANPWVRIFWEQVVLPAVLWQEKLDLLHAMAFVAPLAASCPSLVTIYDLSFLRYPETFKRGNRLYLTQFVRMSARRATHFTAISASTARDIVDLLGVEPGRVSVIYCGVEDKYRPLPPAEVEVFRRQHGLPERMILYLGTIEPRKNIGALIKAYHLLLKSWSAGQGEPPRLVVAGGKGWEWEEVFSLVEELGLGGQVAFPGYVPEDELPWWYNAAACFAYPSRYEGFGLPVLEAMACGAPVVASAAASLPEVVGDAGLMVAPDDTEALARALFQVLTDDDLSGMLREKGRQRAAGFSWARCAQETLAVYDRILAVGGR